MREQLLVRSGVYAIRNVHNGKMYIGSTLQFTKRWHGHRRFLEDGAHPNIILQRAWDKYGADSFQWIILELCEPENLTIREQYWMDWYRSDGLAVGYNVRKVAQSNQGLTSTVEAVEKRRIQQVGQKRTSEQRERIRLGKMGHEVTPETRAKISATKARKYAEGWRPSFVPPPRPLSDELVQQVRDLLAQNVPLGKIEKMLGVSDSTAYRIKAKKPPYDRK